MSFWSKAKSYFSLGSGIKDRRGPFIAAQEQLSTPWAMLEVQDIENENGRIKMSFNFNQAFVDKINSMGFQAETPEDSVQLFFATAGLQPMSLMSGDPAVQPGELPNLSSPQNQLMQ